MDQNVLRALAQYLYTDDRLKQTEPYISQEAISQGVENSRIPMADYRPALDYRNIREYTSVPGVNVGAMADNRPVSRQKNITEGLYEQGGTWQDYDLNGPVWTDKENSLLDNVSKDYLDQLYGISDGEVNAKVWNENYLRAIQNELSNAPKTDQYTADGKYRAGSTLTDDMIDIKNPKNRQSRHEWVPGNANLAEYPRTVTKRWY